VRSAFSLTSNSIVAHLCEASIKIVRLEREIVSTNEIARFKMRDQSHAIINIASVRELSRPPPRRFETAVFFSSFQNDERPFRFFTFRMARSRTVQLKIN